MRVGLVTEHDLAYPGGGEKSMRAVVENLALKNEVIVHTFDPRLPPGDRSWGRIRATNHSMRVKFGLSRFIENELNRGFIERELEKELSDLKSCSYVMTQSLIAPQVASFCRRHDIKYYYYMRDEWNLNVFNNYEVGFRKVLKLIKDVVEFPFTRRYRNENSLAIRNAYKVVANSNYTKKALSEKFHVKSVLVYPALDPRFKQVVREPAARDILYIGGSAAIKGYDIVIKIARRMPDAHFLIVGVYSKRRKVGNMTFLPWSGDIPGLYAKSGVILVPSRCAEGFGRAAAEATLVGIPAVTSDRGGLPEANPRKDMIVTDIDDIDSWISAIDSALSIRVRKGLNKK
jgi:glycosyltransferase involved in cell wall biosynthesis